MRSVERAEVKSKVSCLPPPAHPQLSLIRPLAIAAYHYQPGTLISQESADRY